MRALAALLFSAALAAPLAAQGGVKWEHDLPSAMARAKAEHKPIFMDVWTEWCGWCIRLQRNTFPSAEAQAALRDVVPLSIKTQLRDGTPTENKAIESQFNVDGFPALFMLDENGKVLRTYPGYAEPADFAAFLRGK
ncbi:MAG TPA: thioredoxin family protein [Holophagaceae bacterium]|nr:thioredoxin family protein [Holophagaceae bacterium]